jgi:hypothetical protein
MKKRKYVLTSVQQEGGKEIAYTIHKLFTNIREVTKDKHMVRIELQVKTK